MVRHSLEVPHSQQTKIERLARTEAREGTDVSVKRNKGYGRVICFEKRNVRALQSGSLIGMISTVSLRRGYGGRAHRGGKNSREMANEHSGMANAWRRTRPGVVTLPWYAHSPVSVQADGPTIQALATVGFISHLIIKKELN